MWYDELKRKYPKNWPKIAQQCKDRDKNKCRLCGKSSSPTNKLNACHIDPKRPSVLANLITKCEDCHVAEPKHGHYKNLIEKKRAKKKVKKQLKVKPLFK